MNEAFQLLYDHTLQFYEWLLRERYGEREVILAKCEKFLIQRNYLLKGLTNTQISIEELQRFRECDLGIQVIFSELMSDIRADLSEIQSIKKSYENYRNLHQPRNGEGTFYDKKA